MHRLPTRARSGSPQLTQPGFVREVGMHVCVSASQANLMLPSVYDDRAQVSFINVNIITQSGSEFA